MPVSEEFRSDSTDYREKYKNLKRKLKFLIYENECFQEELRKSQRKLLKVSRDKSFLLDRLMQYEHVGDSTSDSEATVSSDSEVDTSAPKNRKRAASAISNSAASTGHQLPAGSSTATGKHSSESAPKRKKTSNKSKQASKTSVQVEVLPMARSDGHMTSEEIERHLESRQLLLDLLPEKAPPTVPTEMFSNEPSSLDSETHEGGEDTSPSNLGDGFLEDDGLVIDLNNDTGCI